VHGVVQTNRSRSEDCIVTNQLAVALKSIETWPRVASKYIHRPLVFEGCVQTPAVLLPCCTGDDPRAVVVVVVVVANSNKFDLRYIVLVRSFQPLELYVYSTFWIRFANRPYTTSPASLDDYETHFTVMNYGRSLRQMGYEVFVPEIEKQYPGAGCCWSWSCAADECWWWWWW
jgi:tubulin--tyrosine ligase-like protein 12